MARRNYGATSSRSGSNGPRDRYPTFSERLEKASTVPPLVRYLCIKCIKAEVTKDDKVCAGCKELKSD